MTAMTPIRTLAALPIVDAAPVEVLTVAHPVEPIVITSDVTPLYVQCIELVQASVFFCRDTSELQQLVWAGLLASTEDGYLALDELDAFYRRPRALLLPREMRRFGAWFTPAEAAGYLRLNLTSLKLVTRRGLVDRERLGRRLLYHRDALDTYLHGYFTLDTITPEQRVPLWVRMSDGATGE